MPQSLPYGLGANGVYSNNGVKRAAIIEAVNSDGSFNLTVFNSGTTSLATSVSRYQAEVPGKPGTGNTSVYFFVNEETDPGA